uniref:Uncharacterized protein n=1 Tax=Trypanosoma vivax (strain Y486) TaxID=1055687 RepID=G0U3Y4_TRYVY|nr:conserved hypothetical protein [Trypanosoma vivax Y486]
MGRQKSDKPLNRFVMEDGLSAWQRLEQWGVAAELLYAPHSPLHSPPTAHEPHAFVVARRIAAVMARLNELCRREAEVLLTPRAALLELADTIRFGLVSFHREVLLGRLDPAGISAVLAEYVAHRTAPHAGIVEGLHVIAWVSVKLRVEMFTEQLRRRLEGELASSKSDGRAEKQVAALRTTQTLFNDFEKFYDNVLVTFPCMHLMDSTPEAVEQLMPVLIRQYYQLAEWVGLVEASTTLPPIDNTLVHSIDQANSSFVLERTDVKSPWGLIFNDCGRIVDVDVSLRSASLGGEELHRLLRCSTEGATVTSFNNKAVPRAFHGGAAGMLQLMKDSTKADKQLIVKVPRDVFKQPRVRQLAFIMPYQGGEGSSGQRATLVLHRHDRRVPWGCEITRELLVNRISRKELLEDARNFFAEYRGRIGLMAVNGVEVKTPDQAEALCTDTETVVLSFVVVAPSMIKGRRSQVTKQVTEVTLSPEQIQEERETTLVPETSGRPKREAAGVQTEAVPRAQTQVQPILANVVPVENQVMESSRMAELAHDSQPPAVATAQETVTNGNNTQEPAEHSGEAEAVHRPLLFPNGVAIDLLTIKEMIIRRSSPNIMWGLVLKKFTTLNGDALRVLQLPEPTSEHEDGRKHPFFKTFERPPVPREWRIMSVNNTSAARATDVLEIMRTALKMSIKFLK